MAKRQKYNNINKEKIKRQKHIWYQNHKKENREKHKVWCEKHKEERKEYMKKYSKIWRNLHKEEISENKKEYYKLNKIKILIHKKEYVINRLKTDINFKLLHNLRNRIWYALKRNIKSVRTIQLVGCSIENLKKHLENQFKIGMNWSNYGKWHIDHIIPCASFDMSKEIEQKKCFHYTNLQPLWAIENLIKHDKYKGVFNG
jgi:hypothetical protein